MKTTKKLGTILLTAVAVAFAALATAGRAARAVRKILRLRAIKRKGSDYGAGEILLQH